jgi:hypothetical protein
LVLGNGFRAKLKEKDSGDYKVTYDVSFEKTPIVVVTALSKSSDSDRSTTLYKSTKDGFSLQIRKAQNGSRKDTDFNFYASDSYTSS